MISLMNRSSRLVLGACAALTVSLAGGAIGCSGCFRSTGQHSLGIMPGVINDPSNRSLRRSILSYGLGEFCKQLTHRGAPLRMRNDQPAMGRFFTQSCSYQELKNGDVFVRFSGHGYVWTNATWRIGFEATGAVQYNQDFLMDGPTMYAYFRTRSVAETKFKTLMIERGGPLASNVMSNLTNPIAQQILEGQLHRGFTVVRDPDGSADFGLGIIEKGKRPARPYEVSSTNRLTLSNERTEVHGAQLDFLGPFHVEDDLQSLFLHISIDGVPAVDLLVVDKSTGDQWLGRYIHQPGVPHFQGSALMTTVVPIRNEWSRALNVRKGYYYVVIDNSNQVGTVNPPTTSVMPGAAPPSPAALVNDVVQIGRR